MPDATHGVPVWQHSWPGDSSMPVLYGTREAKTAPSRVIGTWYPADEAAALEDLVSATRPRRLRSHVGVETVELVGLLAALDRLDAIRGAA